MAEVTRPIISIMLVLLLGIRAGRLSERQSPASFYRQFAITIAASTVILDIQLADPCRRHSQPLLLRPRHEKPDAFQRIIDRVLGLPFKAFNRLFGRLSKDYGKAVAVVARRPHADSAGLRHPARLQPGSYSESCRAGSFPSQDKQYLIGVVQLPNAASLDRTEKVRSPDVTDRAGDSPVSST